MALMLPRSVFFHIPKTGGVWVREAIKNAGIPTVELTHCRDADANWHNTFRHVPIKGKFTFAFVRNPIHWYPSFWSYRMRNGWKKNDVLDACMSENFEKFIKCVLQKLPAHLNERFKKYIGSPPGILDFVGKQENLSHDLILALKLAGEKFDEEKILSTPRKNESPVHPSYARELLRAVLESERPTMERFGYFYEDRDRTHENQSPGFKAATFALTSNFNHGNGKSLPSAIAFGTSMLPFYRPNDEVWSESVKVSSIQAGDVVTFRNSTNSLVTHRVVKVLNGKEALAFRTKGDNRLRCDPIVLPEQIVGKVNRIGRRDLTKRRWRILGRVVAFFSYIQAKLYVRLETSRLNRLRHSLEQQDLLPKICLQKGFRFLSNPFLLIDATNLKTELLRKAGYFRNNIRSRRWKPADEEEMTAVWNEAFPDYRTTIKRLTHKICQSPWFDPSGCLVATRRRNLLGWVLAGLREDAFKEERARTKVGYLEVLAVTQEGSRLQMENLLIKKAMKWFSQHRIHQVITGPIPVAGDSLGFRPTSAISHLSSYGFMPHGTLWEYRITPSSYRIARLSPYVLPLEIRTWKPGDEGPIRKFFQYQQIMDLETNFAQCKAGDNPNNILLAYLGKKLVGFRRFTPDDEIKDFSQCRSIWSSAEPKLRRGHIFQLIVHREYRRQGIGSVLITKALEILFRKGCEEVCLETPHLNFFERFGFVKSGQFVIMSKN